MKRLLVVGGTGFLGRRICVEALKSGWAVSSISRSGLKDIQGIPPITASQIKWLKADVFDTESYKTHLTDADAVVHSMGTLMDSPAYKGAINQKSLCGLVGVAAEAVRGRNPLDQRSNSGYDRLNRQSAVVLARAFANSGAVAEDTPAQDKPFVYISAQNWNPLIPRGYLESKYAAEADLAAIHGLRATFVRPGFLVDSSGQTMRSFISHAINAGNTVSEALGLGGLNTPAISVDVVARAVVEAIEDSSLRGPIPLEVLHKFANLKAAV